MPRTIRLAAAQMGTTNKWDSRSQTLTRMLTLLHQASTQNAQIVLFPELAFTTFFPRYFLHDSEIDTWFELGDIRTNPATRSLFDTATKLQVDICVGFAEATETNHHFNTCNISTQPRGASSRGTARSTSQATSSPYPTPRP